MKLPGSVALITGASRGLGQAIATQFAARGARLVVTARGAAALEAAVAPWRQQTEVVAIPGDVAEAAHAARLVREAEARFGGVDILINNASELGPSPMPALEDYPLPALETVLRVNVGAPLALSQLVLPGMKSRARGVVVNVTSDAGVVPYAGWGGYGASKAALEHLSRILAAELEGSGVRVYVVDPGDMNTLMHQLAEPGVDLSELPGPDVPAPAFVRLVEDESIAPGRYTAQELREGLVDASR
ncbi:MAG TPA: SDR family oxidoreductase [Chloroflexota bacterium]|nr:SDR family oxidoreductase [Chloroflexota bacterium]